MQDDFPKTESSSRLSKFRGVQNVPKKDTSGARGLKTGTSVSSSDITTGQSRSGGSGKPGSKAGTAAGAAAGAASGASKSAFRTARRIRAGQEAEAFDISPEKAVIDSGKRGLKEISGKGKNTILKSGKNKGIKAPKESALKKFRGSTAKKEVKAAKKSVKKTEKQVRKVTITAARITTKVAAAVIVPLLPILVVAVILITVVSLLFSASYVVINEEMNMQSESVPANSYEYYIWNRLNSYFEGNETATLGIMCSLKAESGFEPHSLENTQNDEWGITNDRYTLEVNNGTVTKEDFIMGRYKGHTNGYYEGGYWVNVDGGYGLAGFTDYNEKKWLYEYAEKYAEEAGVAFDIGSVEAQTGYLIEIMETRRPDLKEKLMAAKDVVEASIVWVSGYEHPVNEESEGYRRALAAEAIRSECKSGTALGYLTSGALKSPRIANEGTGLTWTEVTAHSEWYGNLSPFGSVYSIEGHGGNCTSYVYGRRCELEGGSTDIGQGSWRWDAGTFYDDAVAQGIYETGQVPKPGAVAVWQGAGTSHKHVAIIAIVDTDENGQITRIVTENSGWNGPTLFYNMEFPSLEALKTENPGFAGFIYLEKKGTKYEEDTEDQ